MKFSVNQAAFAKALARVRIDRYMTIDCSGDQATLTCRNLSAFVDVAGAMDGSAVLDIERMRAFIGKVAKDTTVTIDADGPSVIVKAGKSRARIASPNPAAFADTSPIDGSLSFALTKDEVERLFVLPIAAADTNEFRPYLCGIHLHVDNQTLHAVATDGKVILRCSIPSPVADMPPIIIPSSTIDLITKQFRSDVIVTVTDKKFMIRSDQGRLVSPLVAGAFPAYQNLLIHTKGTHITFNRAELLGAVERMAALADITAGPVRISDHVTIAAAGEAYAEASETVEATGSIPDAIVFAEKVFTAGLKALDTETVTIVFNGPENPHLVMSKEDPLIVGVMMPYRSK